MNYDADAMIAMLSPQIERKCEEIKQAHREKIHSRLFVLLCTAVIMIPTLFVFLGISLATLLIPVIFTGGAFLFLSPILINQQGGRTYE